jgi:biotin synthase
MPHSAVRLSAGRQQIGEAFQALAFLAGANSIFYGDKLLTTANPEAIEDRRLLEKLGIEPSEAVNQVRMKQPVLRDEGFRSHHDG